MILRFRKNLQELVVVKNLNVIFPNAVSHLQFKIPYCNEVFKQWLLISLMNQRKTKYIWVNLKFREKKREKAFMPALKTVKPEQLFTYQLYSSFMQNNFNSTAPRKYCSYKNVWWRSNSFDFVDDITETNDAVKHPQVQKWVYICDISIFLQLNLK